MEPEAIHIRMAAAAGPLTLREIAELTEIHPESVRRYMTRDMPSPEFIAAFCHGLGISADWLVLGRDPMTSADAIRRALAHVPEQDLFAAVGHHLREVERRPEPAPPKSLDDTAPLRRPGGPGDAERR